MKCIGCGSDSTKVLETRKAHDLMYRRRHECFGCGGRFTTLQMHETVVHSIGVKSVLQHTHTAFRGLAARVLAATRRLEVRSMLQLQMKSPDIGRKLGITDARVRQIRKEIT